MGLSSIREVIYMEKVICIKCGSMDYTASPEMATCSKCGGRHKAIAGEYGILKPVKKIRILSLLSLVKKIISAGRRLDLLRSRLGPVL